MTFFTSVSFVHGHNKTNNLPGNDKMSPFPKLSASCNGD